MSNQINTRSEWSIKSEANRVLQTCAQIGKGFFQLNGFLVLPPGSTDGTKTVILPRLDYSSIPNFWSTCANIPLHTLPITTHQHLLSVIEQQLLPLNLQQPSATTQAWDQIASEFWSLLNLLVPNISKRLRSLTIYPTHYGTLGSFGSLHPDPSSLDLVIYPRADASPSTIAELILSAIFKRELEKNHQANWGETEVVVDWLLHDSALSVLFPNNAGTLASLRQPSAGKLLQQSKQYLAELGAPALDKPFSKLDGLPLFNNHPIRYLTGRETNILSQLIDSPTHSLTYDQLADIIFANDHDYSLAVLSKVIDRLREKFERNGISKSYLATERGIGYFLQN